ncbi:thyroid receptor-interacting protein 11-like isoform X2 [Daphnia carinata]|uniref:thyroid receptor-interacting protein 11-like isoform X2 n=1 Tax=Daphnia carinata TaxID=120202 RepID=UPI00257DAE45|nr:thyroid receptor-interacting protein 11-like isoform X2 [Daphnia carinata]
MSWFGGGLSNLQGKISSFTAQVLNEVAESVQENDNQLTLEQAEEVAGTTGEIFQLKKQNEELISINREIESQLSTLSRQYRNLLSSSKVVELSWQKDVQQWLKSQGLELPPALSERIISNRLNRDGPGHDEEDEAYTFLNKKVASLEEQLVDLDQQHQAALEVAVTSRDQLKEENRQLQLQLMQLLNDRQQEQQTKSGPLFPIHEEFEEVDVELAVDTKPATEDDIKRLEDDQNSFRQEIFQFQQQFQAMSDSLKGFESIQFENDKLKQEITALRETASKWESNCQAKELRLNEENTDLKAKFEALQSQNQILSSMTSVLDRVTNENRLLESNLESANETVQVKSDLIEQLKAELLSLQTKQQTTIPPSLVQNDATTEPHLDWPDIQRQIDEKCQLQAELEELKAQTSSETSRIEELSKENEILAQQMLEVRKAFDSCQIKMEEAEATRLKLETDSTKNHCELMLCKSELERIQEEKRLLESNIDSLNQVLTVRQEQVDHIQIERQNFLEELERLRGFQESNKIEASTETNSDEQDIQTLTEENLLLQAKIKDLCRQHEQEFSTLKHSNDQLSQRLVEYDEAAKKAQIHVEEAEGRRLDLEAKLGQLQDELDVARKQYDELSNSNAVQDEVVSRLQSDLEEYRLTLSETRDLCEKESRRNEELSQLCDVKTKEAQRLQEEIEILHTRQLVLEEGKNRNSDLEKQILALTKEIEIKSEEMNQIVEQLELIRRERDDLNRKISESNTEKEGLRETIQAFQQQREQLVQTVQQKHQEAVNYHAETLRLAKICEELQIRLNEQNELEQETVRLRSEAETFKSVVAQKQAEIERLRSHLLSVEETYTQELLKSQTKEKTLRESLQSAEERATEQWRLGDQLNVWQDKYRQCVTDKDRLEKEKVDLEKSLDRLQHALQQLTRERERDIVLAQKELAQKLAFAESLQNEKDSEMNMLRRKLSEAQLGLEAAGRLTQQLDKTTAALATAKHEVRTKEAELAHIRHQMEEMRSGTDSKVDRSLVKNLLMGYFSAPSAKSRIEVLRIIATVMDFSNEERRKSGVEESSSGLSGWATGLLKMTTRSRTSSGNSSTGDGEKSLSEAFISFLETESTRPSPPKLPSQKVDGSPSQTKLNNSMAEFQPGRNEPTILRDVLRDTET